MAKKPRTTETPKVLKDVETLRHTEERRKNIPTAEHQSVLEPEQKQPRTVRYARNLDLDPQLVWRGKDEQDWNDLVVQAPPLYIQEKVHPKVLIEDLLRQTRAAKAQEVGYQPDLFGDFNGIPEGVDKTEFYQHDQNWTNRMILGDSLQVMASLAEREGLRGKVQCIYVDPPYGIKFNSNFQWSTTSRDVKDGKADHITREPEQVKAFRDTWRDGIHSYLTYLRDRLTVARDLLTASGTIFVQIGDENVHRVRALMDEVFGTSSYVATIGFQKTGSTDQALLPQTVDYILVFAKDVALVKYRQLYLERSKGTLALERYDNILETDGTTRPITREEAGLNEIAGGGVRSQLTSLSSARPAGEGDLREFRFNGVSYTPGTGTFKTDDTGLRRLTFAGRARAAGRTLRYLRRVDDFPVVPVNDRWESVQLGTGLTYVVQTSSKVIERCILMASDPGDLVLDPTCGSGTTATVAEQWGRRWITIDTSRVALALARARVMGARYPFFLLADSHEGQQKEAELSRTAPRTQPTHGNVRHGFVYERVSHITLKSIANNAEIDVIWEKWQQSLEPLRAKLNAVLGKSWAEWEIPRKFPSDKDKAKWPTAAEELHTEWWHSRIARQQEIDASIQAKAEYEYLYDKPSEDRKKVRVAGPFTVESLSPHRVLAVDENDELIDPHEVKDGHADYAAPPSFDAIILENLRLAGVQQAHKEDRVTFTTLAPWPGRYICAEGRYGDGQGQKRAGIFIGPEFGTVTRPDLVEAAREAGDAGFDVLIACAFNFEAHATEFSKLGRIPILKARMNADLHMAQDLKTTGKGNLFVIFGEPDIELVDAGDDRVMVKIRGVDVFDPTNGEVRSDNSDGIACWFVDTDYNGESFFVRHAYFLGANDPYKVLKTTLKAEVNEIAWASLHSDLSRPFPKPQSGRIAVKVINHLGDEVMKVFRV
jgi:adenine-specific DNA-methyltransferase